MYQPPYGYPVYPPPKKKPNLALWASIGCAGAVILPLLACGACGVLGMLREKPERAEPTPSPEPAPTWKETPETRQIAGFWTDPYSFGEDMGCKRMTCRDYGSNPPFSDVTWAEASKDTTAKRIVLNGAPVSYCDWTMWAPDADNVPGIYNGYPVYRLKGGSFDGVYFTGGRTLEPCTITLMTRTWPAHRDD